MQRKISSTVQRIHCQLTGPAIAGRYKCLTMYHRPLCFRGSRVNTEILELWPWPCNINTRAAISVWRYINKRITTKHWFSACWNNYATTIYIIPDWNQRLYIKNYLNINNCRINWRVKPNINTKDPDLLIHQSHWMNINCTNYKWKLVNTIFHDLFNISTNGSIYIYIYTYIFYITRHFVLASVVLVIFV
jgi:hypothetical protein